MHDSKLWFISQTKLDAVHFDCVFVVGMPSAPSPTQADKNE